MNRYEFLDFIYREDFKIKRRILKLGAIRSISGYGGCPDLGGRKGVFWGSPVGVLLVLAGCGAVRWGPYVIQPSSICLWSIRGRPPIWKKRKITCLPNKVLITHLRISHIIPAHTILREKLIWKAWISNHHKLCNSFVIRFMDAYLWVSIILLMSVYFILFICMFVCKATLLVWAW